MTQQLLTDAAAAFCQELQHAQHGKPTSLPFIRQTLAKQPLVLPDKQFQIIIIGGSVFKKALAVNHEGKIQITALEEREQPRFLDEASFLSFVTGEIAPCVDTLALNFAYPLSPHMRSGRPDGVLISGSKENTFVGLPGKLVGQTLERYIEQHTKRQLSVAVANDTICLLLSGLTQYPAEKLVGGIVGTGCNFAFFLDETTTVNLESANTTVFPQTPEGKIIDQRSTTAGKGLFEKEIAGAYLYQHFNLLVAKNHLPFLPMTSTKELKTRVHSAIPREAALAKELINRSAAFIAAQMAGILLYKQVSLTFVMEGSFFWEGPMYQETVKHYLSLLVPQFPSHIVHIPQSTYLGAAKLVA